MSMKLPISKVWEEGGNYRRTSFAMALRYGRDASSV